MGWRSAVTANQHAEEAGVVAQLLDAWRAVTVDGAAVAELARQLITAVRGASAGAAGVDQLLQEFSLSTQEGVALMCLAEALLRIPDQDNIDRLIRDKVGRGDWRAHLGHSDSLFVNAAAWGLLIGRKLVSTSGEQKLSSALGRVVARGGEPLLRRALDLAMRLLGQQFVIGQSIAAALKHSQGKEAQGYRYSYDMLGEAALTVADAERYLAAYRQAIEAIGAAARQRGVYAGPGISVKLSALHPRFERSQRQRVLEELLPRLKGLCQLARAYAIGINIDAEEADRLDLSLDLLEALALDPDLDGWDGIGFAVQAYQKPAIYVIEHLLDLARRSGHRLMVRLVKGAYWDSEIKRAQVAGLEGYPVFTRKQHTDAAYLVCAWKLLAAGATIYPQFATHNAHSVATIVDMARAMAVDDYEFQCLHGMGEALYDQVVGPAKLGRSCRIYAPVGNHQSLLPYLVRRLLENGANSSFVNRVVDPAVDIEELIADPFLRLRASGGAPHPAIPLPGRIYGEARRNSSGLDLANEAQLTRLAQEQSALAQRRWEAAPMLAAAAASGGDGRVVFNPADRQDRVGQVIEATPQDVAAALAAAKAFAAAWSAVPVGERAATLERAADLLELERPSLVSLCVREAGKSWANAVAEVREAADYCRYYAQQLRRHGDAGRAAAAGPVICISPWNFPLAIFVGQVAAALLAGHPVIAKPAQQTPLTAALAVGLMRRAGVPAAALQLLPGRGDEVGAALVADARIRGVIFTGSLAVAQGINRAIAGREAILIAETGGQNAMIVDSTALPEQVVHDVLASAFDSAGQRCSALRVLCVQEEIADKLLLMLEGAMAELRVGDPASLATDVGPLIDAQAQAAVLAHIDRMRARGKRVTELPLPAACAAGSFVAPTLIEIEAIEELQQEVFGPVLHFLRFRRGDLDALVDAINATGYGLTLGLHSRIDETIDQVVGRARVGNIYINRNMIGAVVGVQPFGGLGWSGTGPKAGGPLYLHRLLGSRQVPPPALGLGAAATAGGQRGAIDELGAWASASARDELAGLCAELQRSTLLGSRWVLSGPTGESNTLTFCPRGTALCRARSEAQLLLQIAAAFACGADILVEASALAASLLGRLPESLLRRIRPTQDWQQEDFALVLVADDCGVDGSTHDGLLLHRGALVPQLRAREDGALAYPLYRLLTERVVSANSAALGGNASLMALPD